MTRVGVLLVGGAVDVDLASTGLDVATVESIEDAEEYLAELTRASDAVHSVVAAVDGPGDPVFDLAERVHAHNHLLPVILVGEPPLADVATDVLDADVADYVCLEEGKGETASALTAAIEDAADRYRRRLDRARIHPDLPDTGCVVRDGEIAAAGAAFGERFDADDVVGQPLAALVEASDRERIESALSSADESTTELQMAPAHDRHTIVECRIRRSPADGAIVVRAHDVTERANEWDAMTEAAGQLDALLQNIPMSIYFKDELGRHERVSDHLTHYSDPENFIMNDEGKVHPHADDIVGKTDFDLYAPSFAEETYADDMRVIEDEEQVINRIEEGTTRFGEPHHTSTTKVPRYDEAGNVVGLVGVTIDVTERVAHREELERQNERLNEFAEVLTHDLRNPLNIANGYLDVLEESYDEEAVDEITNALGRMESLIEEIRSFVLEGRLVEEPEAVDLRGAAEEAWSTVDTPDATLEFDGDLTLRADRARFRRLLENLFRNALEHGVPDGDADDGVPLTVRIVGGNHQFAVEDDGVGIPPESIADIFDRGYSTSEDGTGFGLAIVESIAEAHGWSIDVEESDAGGTRFVFTDVVQAETTLGRTIA